MRSNSSALKELAFTRVGPAAYSSIPAALRAPPRGAYSRTAEALLRVAGWDTAGRPRYKISRINGFVKDAMVLLTQP